MKKLLYAMTALIGLALIAQDAEARRLGGGRNLGMQRSLPAQQPAAPKAPAQQPQQQQAAQPSPAQQPAATPKWLAPLTGFALGAGLAALLLDHGWAGVAAALLMLALLAAGLAFLARALRARVHRQALRYATAGAGIEPGSGSCSAPGALPAMQPAARWPAGFDAAEFVRHARRNFVRLQEANDRGDLSTLRDFLTPALLRELEAEARAAGISGQRTEVLELRAEVLDLAAEPDRYVASVRFEGLAREAPGTPPEPFQEIWHLEKPAAGASGWLLAGIQQA
ncbi:MAG TPA: Tim44-like domain-containing protein [Burkholderiales bacterium]|nr:Tim44-like domain-containing protein [Burkholderiales bacterium]